MITVGLEVNGSTAKTASRTRSAPIIRRFRCSLSTSEPKKSPITTVGRKSAIKRPLTHDADPVRSQTLIVSAIAASQVPIPEARVA